MTQPAREKKDPEANSPSNPKRVQKGRFTIELNPKPTSSIRKICALFTSWLKSYPGSIAAQFGGIPTGFPGVEQEGAAEIKRKSQSADLREAQFKKKAPQQETPTNPRH